jgi:hypothetical protein
MAATDPAASDAEGSSLFKFPRTSHIADAGGSGVTRDDLLMSADDAAAYFDGKTTIVVEEKVDGANLGISIDPETSKLQVQNRSHFVTSSSATQFSGIDRWLATHSADLWSVLKPGRHVLFGEWVQCMHSIHYTRLPDTFLAFDIYDRKYGRFMSRAYRDTVLRDTSIVSVPQLTSGVFSSVDELLALLDSPSQFREEGPVEGIVCRIDDPPPEKWNKARGKIVRPDFVQGITDHWSKREPVKNIVRVDC